MFSSRLQFDTKLNELTEYVDFIEMLRKLLATDIRQQPRVDAKSARLLRRARKLRHLFSVLLGNQENRDFSGLQSAAPERSTLRRFQYNSLIVSIYGSFERFVEDTLVEFSRKQNKSIGSYSSLPNVVRSKNLELTTHLLQRIDEGRFSAITPQLLVQRLNSCLNGDPDFEVNHEAFALHTANYRHVLIGESFSNLGVHNVLGRASQTEPFSTHLINKVFAGEAIHHKKNVEIYQTIDDLAERRNSVAHGVEDPMLSIEIIRDYITYLSGFATSLCRVLENDWLAIESSSRGISLNPPIAVHDNKIFCFKHPGLDIKIGQLLISETGENPCKMRHGVVEEIQVNGESMKNLTTAEEPFALKSTFQANHNSSFFLVPFETT